MEPSICSLLHSSCLEWVTALIHAPSCRSGLGELQRARERSDGVVVVTTTNNSGLVLTASLGRKSSCDARLRNVVASSQRERHSVPQPPLSLQRLTAGGGCLGWIAEQRLQRGGYPLFS